MSKQTDRFKAKLRELGNLWNKIKTISIKLIILLFLLVTLIAQIYPPLQSYISSQKYILLAIGAAMMYLFFDSIVSPAQETVIEHSIIAKHFIDLRPYLETTFNHAIIEIDIAAYSGETFYNVMTEFLQGVLDSKYRPTRLHLRLIVPNCSANMFIPCEVIKLKEHEGYKASIQERNKRFANEFAHYFTDIKKRFPKIDLLLSIRMHRFSPLFKFIRIKPQIVFFGIYPISETPVTIGGEHIKLWDFRGERAIMIGLPADGNKSDVELAKELSQWFESVWKNLCEKVVEVKSGKFN